MGLFEKIFGTYSQRELKNIRPIVDRVLSLEDKYKAMSDRQLQEQTPALKARLAAGETLDDILPDAFAVCREAADRVLGMRPFPVQVLGGVVLHQGRIAEMKTGEGKTLVATLPAYLNALEGKGVHIVTVNDYLAKRDSEWMGKVYRFLGLSVGLIVHDLNSDQRRQAYAADITYGTNNEMGFDYLRDNMAVRKENQVQRGHHYAIVDEVDSILIDEARTPLIISGPGAKSTDLYQLADQLVRKMRFVKVKELDAKEEHDDVDGDYIVDEKARTATLTPAGVKKAEAFFQIDNLMDMENATYLHHVNQAIKAYGIMHRDIDYVVKDGQVLIVDEFTGRIMMGRRYNEGLHQAIEAKEGVSIQKESQTLATITVINEFRCALRKNFVLSRVKNNTLERVTDTVLELKASGCSPERIIHVGVHNLLFEVCLCGSKFCLFGLQAVLELFSASLHVFELLLDGFVRTFGLQLLNLSIGSIELGLQIFGGLKFGLIITENALDIIIALLAAFLSNTRNTEYIGVILAMKFTDTSTDNGVLVILRHSSNSVQLLVAQARKLGVLLKNFNC